MEESYRLVFMTCDDVIEDLVTSTNIGWLDEIIGLSGKYYEKYTIFEKVDGEWKALQTIERRC